MPVYIVEGPDGRKYRVEGPNGASAEQLGAFITEQMSNQQVKRSAQELADRKAANPTKEMSGIDLFRSGAGKAFADIGRGVGQLIGAVDRADVAESRKLDRPLMETGSGQSGNLVGNVAAFAPTALLPGANTVVGGALIGAGSGLIQPSTSTAETLRNVGVGTLSGAAVPAAITTAKTAKSFIDPLYQGGRDKIVGRAIADASATDPATLAKALRANATSAVPGVERTVAEAAQNPSLAALQRTATQTSPAVMNDATARSMANNDARIAALRTISPDRQAATQAREAATKSLYGAADTMPVDAAPLADLMGRPSMQQAIGRAKQLAAEAGETFDLQNLTGRGAHYIKKAMDDIANSPPTQGIGANEQRAVRDTLTEYLGRLEQQLPPYGQARQTFAQMSRPVNQADVVDEIAKNSVNFRGNMTPAAYARALSDKTVQNVTGQANATISKVMEPGQMATLKGIQDDLMRADFAQTAGKGVGSDTVQKLAYNNMLNQAGVPSAIRNFGPSGVIGNVAERAGQVIYKDANEKLAEQLARALMNPLEAADLVSATVVSPQLQALANGLRRAGAAGGASVPALVQANQQ